MICAAKFVSYSQLNLLTTVQIANLSSQKDSIFKAAVSCHPAMVHPDDAPGVTIPYLMIPTKDENKDDVAKWEAGLKVKGQVEWFDDQIHGFMAARYVLN